MRFSNFLDQETEIFFEQLNDSVWPGTSCQSFYLGSSHPFLALADDF